MIPTRADAHRGHEPTTDGKRFTLLHERVSDQKPKLVRGLITPGRGRVAHLPARKQTRQWRVLKFRVWPHRLKRMRERNMSNRDRFLRRLRVAHNFTRAEIDASDWLLRRESCGAYSEWAYFGSCLGTPGYNRNGENIACGVPQFLPCRHHGDLLAQADAFARYVRGRYGGIFGAADFKRRTGWY